jgi:hypothetical protein
MGYRFLNEAQQYDLHNCYASSSKVFEQVRSDKNIIWYTLSESLNCTDYRFLGLFNFKDNYVFINCTKEGADLCEPGSCERINEIIEEYGILKEKLWFVTGDRRNDESEFNHVYWEMFEDAVKGIEFPELDVNEKYNEKSFLCLNRWDKPWRRALYNGIRLRKLLPYFNYSIGDIGYDNVDKTRSLWDNINKSFATDNMIWLVTETLFDSYEFMFITEKTYKPILMKMPFIIVGCAGTLKRLRENGYKTFSHMWDESYDDIIDPRERMDAIIDVVESLCNKGWDLYDLIMDNVDVYEYNYQNMMNRKADAELVKVLNGI